jgi:hypothetical protein
LDDVYACLGFLGGIEMSTPWFASHADPKATGGGASPDPVTAANTNWTWDVEFDPVNQSLYARASLCNFANIGGDSGWVSGGIVQYRTRKNGVDKVHHVGLSGHDGIADFMWDSNVDSVTFGWMIEGDDIVEGGINFEIWK